MLHVDDVGAFLPVLVLAVEDADEIEAPRLAAVLLREDVGGDRDLLAEFPAVLLGDHLAGDHAGTRVGEGLPLALGHHVLRVDVVMAQRIDREHDERRVLLPHAAEPLRVPDARHAGDGLELRQHADRQRRGEGHARLDYEARGTDEVGARAEDAVHRLQQPEQQKRHDHRQQRQDGARPLAEQVGDDEAALGHGESPVCRSIRPRSWVSGRGL